MLDRLRDAVAGLRVEVVADSSANSSDDSSMNGGDDSGNRSRCPSSIWAVRTDVYLDFLWRSVDKFATGFEIIRSPHFGQPSKQPTATWEQTKMIAMFLRCLRFVLAASDLQREPSLWSSRRTRRQGNRLQIMCGLGFSETLPRLSYY
jgi:hypothetical protein